VSCLGFALGLFLKLTVLAICQSHLNMLRALTMRGAVAALLACWASASGEAPAPVGASTLTAGAADAAFGPKLDTIDIERWNFKWDDTSPIQGPYPTSTMIKWAKSGYFAQSEQPAMVKLASQDKAGWVPYDTIDFVAYADFMQQVEKRAASKLAL